ncbi:hypothetical protein BXZ70DRAFT_1007009 [Cristinia sonorae]|uniref:F-box domain-containing protein n=1 Tax=Cristinia sonorae TaxID=1940300 RepID=A0A8K0XR28_9AGAR|nr:hypothetical protein BXZ70DRAFT_1007009 [Cristinia sonorae]
MGAILDLPNEILEKILLQTDLTTISQCRYISKVSKAFNEVISGSISILYKLELAVDGFQDGNIDGMNVAERLEALRSRRSAWAAMQPAFKRKITMGRHALVDITRGHFAWLDDEKALHVLQIPSVFRGIPEKEWVVQGAVGGILANARSRASMDPDEDILLIAEHRRDLNRWVLSIRSLTTGEHRPEAEEADLPSFIADWGAELKPTVYRDYVGLEYVEDKDYNDEFYRYIYNWKTGEVLLSLYGDAVDFTFVSEEYLLVLLANPKSGYAYPEAAISVIHLPTFAPTAHSRRVMTDLSQLQKIATVQLVLPDCEHHDLAYAQYRGCKITAAPTRPWQRLRATFHPAVPGDQNIVIHTGCYGEEGCALILPWSAIRQGIEKGREEQRSLLKWPEWGPRGVAPFRRISTLDKLFTLPWSKGLAVAGSSQINLGPLLSMEYRVRVALSDHGPGKKYGIRGFGDDCIIAFDSNTETEYYILAF